jgi:signal transduction histidine kinase
MTTNDLNLLDLMVSAVITFDDNYAIHYFNSAAKDIVCGNQTIIEILNEKYAKLLKNGVENKYSFIITEHYKHPVPIFNTISKSFRVIVKPLRNGFSMLEALEVDSLKTANNFLREKNQEYDKKLKLLTKLINIKEKYLEDIDTQENSLLLNYENHLTKELSFELALSKIYETLISSDSTIEEIKLTVLEQAKALTNSRIGYITLIDSETENHSICFSDHTLSDNVVNEDNFRELLCVKNSSESFKGWEQVLLTSKPYYSNIPKPHLIFDYFTDKSGEQRHLLNVPVIIDNKLAGQITLSNPEETYTNDDLSLVSRLARFYALAIKRKKQEVELKRAKESAEEAVRLKASFLANMSHEIRTPLNGMIGMTNIVLYTTELTGEQKDCLELVKSSSYSLLRIVNDILDYSKLEADRVSLDQKPFNISTLLNQIVNLFNVTAKQKNLYLNLTIDSTLPSTLIGDETRLRQVLSNLIGNAVKFTSVGGITINVYPIRAFDKTLEIKFDVCDTGIGISKDDLKLLFKEFMQLDSSYTKRYSGTGLGLAICKRLVEMMNGEIGVASEEGIGSCFHFTLKFNKKQVI